MSGHIHLSLISNFSTRVPQIRNPRKRHEHPRKWCISKTVYAIVMELCAKVAYHTTERAWKKVPDKKHTILRKSIFCVGLIDPIFCTNAGLYVLKVQLCLSAKVIVVVHRSACEVLVEVTKEKDAVLIKKLLSGRPWDSLRRVKLQAFMALPREIFDDFRSRSAKQAPPLLMMLGNFHSKQVSPLPDGIMRKGCTTYYWASVEKSSG